ncbi:MAG: hypothetical protein C0514_06275 [Candidatus Puniceispirillum sp.]|nr:hypothetical protein [Candidatus Puniceispirillum sp.]
MKIILTAAAVSLWAGTACGTQRTDTEPFLYDLPGLNYLFSCEECQATPSFYSALAPEMKEKWNALPLVVKARDESAHLQDHIAALEPEDVEKLKNPQCSVPEVIGAAAKRFAARHNIPEVLSDIFAREMSRRPLRESLVSLVEDYCCLKPKESLQDFNEVALTQLLTHLFLVHGDAVFGKSPRGVLLSAYLQEQDYDKAANRVLGQSVGEETLAKAPLALKLRAIPLVNKDLGVERLLMRVIPMEESRALAILSFLRISPLAHEVFWEAEKGLSTTYITWLTSANCMNYCNVRSLLKCGELNEDQRRELRALASYAQRDARVNEWLREKSGAA